jgi:hypothetical protein
LPGIRSVRLVVGMPRQDAFFSRDDDLLSQILVDTALFLK